MHKTAHKKESNHSQKDPNHLPCMPHSVIPEKKGSRKYNIQSLQMRKKEGELLSCSSDTAKLVTICSNQIILE